MTVNVTAPGMALVTTIRVIEQSRSSGERSVRTSRLLAPLLLIVAASCSGGASSFHQPRASAFTAGSCRDLAPSVLRLGRDLHGLGSNAPTREQQAAIKAAQTDVRNLQPRLPTSLAAVVQELVTTVGILRLRTDTDSYDPSLAGTAMTAYRGVVTACTAPHPASS
ncbi:MAG: hypothetical protein JWP14_765 [Frankiales bacterium]|nr:hypothetical protein [Frankiales bacterium]